MEKTVNAMFGVAMLFSIFLVNTIVLFVAGCGIIGALNLLFTILCGWIFILNFLEHQALKRKVWNDEGYNSGNAPQCYVCGKSDERCDCFTPPIDS